MLIQPINFTQPLLDRRFDFNREELTAIELSARLVKKMNEVVDFANTVDGKIAAKEDSSNITNNRKLSPTGNFTGTVAGRAATMVIAGIDTNRDNVRYLASQFADGQTGQVIDGGFFEEDFIKRNYDGGVF